MRNQIFYNHAGSTQFVSTIENGDKFTVYFPPPSNMRTGISQSEDKYIYLSHLKFEFTKLMIYIIYSNKLDTSVLFVSGIL